MRVGVVTTSYPREEGDPAGLFVEGFARWLAGRGAEVEVIAAGPGQARVGGIAVERVDGRGLFYEGGAPDALGAGGAATWARAAAFQAVLWRRVLARRDRWDAVVSHWLVPSSLAVEAARPPLRQRSAGAGRSARWRHLAIAHSSDVWLLHRSMGGRTLLRALSRRADLVYAGPHLAEVGRRVGAPGRVVAMGVDTATLRGDRAAGRARFGLTRPTALFLGRLVPVKGLELLLGALPDGLDLVVAGDGPLRARLERSAPARVRFVGEVRGAVKGELLSACDLLVLPSLRLDDGRQEGTPTVLREALAVGLPILATRTGGVEALVGAGAEHGAWAVLVEPEPSSMRAALTRFVAEPATWPGGTEAERQQHDWSAVGPRLAGRLLDPA